jgi:hypothetical protein
VSLPRVDHSGLPSSPLGAFECRLSNSRNFGVEAGMAFAGLARNPCPERDVGFGIIFLPHHRRPKRGLGVRQKGGTFLFAAGVDRSHPGSSDAERLRFFARLKANASAAQELSTIGVESFCCGRAPHGSAWAPFGLISSTHCLFIENHIPMASTSVILASY